MRKRSRVHGSGLAVFFFCLSLCLYADDAPHKVVNLVGTFNDWNPADPNYRMTYTGNGEYRIKKFFRAGQYKCKFTVDGDWAMHYGLGEAGKLSK